MRLLRGFLPNLHPTWRFLLAPCLLALTGCPQIGTSQLTSLINMFKSNTLTIRVASSTGLGEEVDLEVDGTPITLPVCEATGSACDYLLDSCPSRVVVIEERRLNADGSYAGGRILQDNPDFIFDPGEFECGATIILQFSALSAEATVVQ